MMNGPAFAEAFARPAQQLVARSETIEGICAREYATTAEERARHARRHLRWLIEEAQKLDAAIAAAVPEVTPCPS